MAQRQPDLDGKPPARSHSFLCRLLARAGTPNETLPETMLRVRLVANNHKDHQPK